MLPMTSWARKQTGRSIPRPTEPGPLAAPLSLASLRSGWHVRESFAKELKVHASRAIYNSAGSGGSCGDLKSHCPVVAQRNFLPWGPVD
jgi:hypothetical protein